VKSWGRHEVSSHRWSDGVTRVSRDSVHWEDTFVFSETIGNEITSTWKVWHDRVWKSTPLLVIVKTRLDSEVRDTEVRDTLQWLDTTGNPCSPDVRVCVPFLLVWLISSVNNFLQYWFHTHFLDFPGPSPITMTTSVLELSTRIFYHVMNR
jgi:hypothetical protein